MNEVPADDNAANFNFFGSTLVCRAESKEAVLEQLKKDIYVTSGVWDIEKVTRFFYSLTILSCLFTTIPTDQTQVQIYPFICAFRNP